MQIHTELTPRTLAEKTHAKSPRRQDFQSREKGEGIVVNPVFALLTNCSRNSQQRVQRAVP
jgi:hypothetical protein